MGGILATFAMMRSAAQQQDSQGFVRVEFDFLQGRRTLKTIQSLRRGTVLARESALLVAEADNDVARLAAYLSLSPDDRQELLKKVITNLELSQFCHPPEDEDVDEMKGLLIEVDHPDLDVMRAAEGIARWRISAHVCKTRIYRILSKTGHSCAAQVELEHDSTGTGSIVARYEVGPSEWIGAWLLEDCHLWYKGADRRSLELRALGMLPEDVRECRCRRCQGADVCRALRCPRCSKGEIVRNGKDKLWRCELPACGFEGADGDAAVVALTRAESRVRQDLHLDEASTEELYAHVRRVSEELGPGHWLHGAAWWELYRRHLGAEQGQSFCSAAAGLCFLDWLASRRLPTPPPGLVEELVTMISGILDFLKAQASGEGVRDLRVVYLRACTLASELLDGFGNPRLFERLKPMLAMAVNMRRRCGFCKNRLAEVGQEPEEYPDTFGDDDGAEVEESVPAGCRVCGELAYCDVGCQVADSLRHKAFCVPCGEGLGSNRVRRMLVPTA